MPQLGETVTEGTITKWFKAVGDSVARDEPLFEVSTDKVDSEVPSPAEGVLTAILVEEGDTVDVGVALAVISAGAGADGGTDGSGAAPPAGKVAEEKRAVGLLPDEPVGQASTSEPREATAQAAPAPPPAPVAPAASPVAPPPAPAPVAPTATSPVMASGERLVLSPVVRRLLNDHQIDPTTITGTGLGGRITRKDVEARIASEVQAEPAPVPSIPDRRPATTGRTAPPVEPASEESVRGGKTTQDEVVPFTNIRRRTAEHMVRSKATSAHTLMVKEIDYERVEQVRRSHGEKFRTDEGFSLTYLPFAARAAVEAIEQFPYLNSSVGEDALIVHHGVNLGIAVDLDNQGLIVPVVHNAEELNLRGMARRIRDLADRARTKRLSLDDISGGTFSITNAGPFGTLITGAIINQPQVAILSTDGVSRKPVVVELPDGSESITIHSVGLVAMNFDHRAIDGAYVARFLALFSEILHDRDWAGEL
jgi:2-oxoglutarate dehydrogenase E2 component (dihydrolipoamide succinyltransferase)